MTSRKDKKPQQVRITNKRASFDYEFLEEYDAGIVLVGTEIKSIRAGKASLQDAYCYFANGELYVRGMKIATYFWASAWSSHEPLRDRKLLLTARELKHLAQAVKTKGLTLEGAARQLASGRSNVDKRVRALDSLKEIRAQLVEVRKSL